MNVTNTSTLPAVVFEAKGLISNLLLSLLYKRLEKGSMTGSFQQMRSGVRYTMSVTSWFRVSQGRSLTILGQPTDTDLQPLSEEATAKAER
jgi:hypothetical protein